MSWSPYKDMVIGYVARNPGCSKWDVASYCTHNAQRCPSKQYYIVNTALRNGWIAGVQIGRQYRLYVPRPTDGAIRRLRADRRRVAMLPSLAERLAAHKARKLRADDLRKVAVLKEAGFTVSENGCAKGNFFIGHPNHKNHGRLWADVAHKMFVGVPTPEEAHAALAQVEAASLATTEAERQQDQERLARELAEYAAKCALPPGRIAFDSEGCFRVENN